MAKTSDMTQGEILPTLLKFTFPILVGDMFQQFYNIVDTMIVGRTLGTNALAAVGSTGTLMFLIVGVCTALANGFAIVTAQRFGAKDENGVRRSFANGFLLTLLISGIGSILSLVFIREILLLMNTPEDIYEGAYLYISVIIAGLSITSAYNYLAANLRAVGNSKVPLYLLILSSFLNIFLDIFFIVYLHMGTDGASKATVLSQFVSAAGCIVYICMEEPALRPKPSDWRPDREICFKQLGIGVPMALQTLITASGTVIMQSATNIFGSTVVAANTAASKVRLLFTQPFISLGLSIASFCGQNYGAGNHKRVLEGVKVSAITVVIYSVVAGIAANLLIKPGLYLFVSDTASIEAMLPWAKTYMFYTSLLFIPLGWIFVYRNALQSCGHSVYAMSAGIVEFMSRLILAFAAIQFENYVLAVLCDGSAWLTAGIFLMVSFYGFARRSPKNEVKNIDNED